MLAETTASAAVLPAQAELNVAGGEYSLINLMRFVAAAWVLVFHANLHFGSLPALGLVTPIIEQGVLAMSLFFILSGFILSSRYAAFPDRHALVSFYIARVSRLYPVYLVMGILTVWTLSSQMGNYTLGSGGTLKTMVWLAIVGLMFVTATQAWFPSLFPVWNFGGSWSLSVEAFFYALFPMLRTRLDGFSDKVLLGIVMGVPVLAIAMVAGLQASRTPQGDMSLIFYSVPIYRLPEFILGIAGFLLFKSRNHPITSFLAFSAVLALIGLIFIFTVGDLAGNIDYGGFFMGLFLCAMVFFARHHALNINLAKFLDWLGHVSYCLYLVQFGTVPAFKTLLAGYPAEAQWSIFVGTNFVFAVLMFYAVETPLRRPVRNLLLAWFGGRNRLKATT